MTNTALSLLKKAWNSDLESFKAVLSPTVTYYDELGRTTFGVDYALNGIRKYHVNFSTWDFSSCTTVFEKKFTDNSVFQSIESSLTKDGKNVTLSHTILWEHNQIEYYSVRLRAPDIVVESDLE